MRKFDIIIIGAGASGCMLAIELAKTGKKVGIFDKGEKPAKRLLVTGNGRCNLTNKNMNSEYYNQNIDKFLSRFGYQETEEKFASFGLDVYYDDCGRCYPVSNSAKTVQFVLIEQLEQQNVEFINLEVVDIEKNIDNYVVKTSNNMDFKANSIVFACAINDFAISMLEKFGIEYGHLAPTLVALKTKENTKTLDGQRISNVLVTTNIEGKLKAESGEILFKDHGLSGICIFNISSYFAKNKSFSGKIYVNLLPKWQKNDIFENINKKMYIFKNVHKSLISLFSKEMATEILKRANIEKDKAKLSKHEIDAIVETITNLQFDVEGSYSNNQVTSGGVMLEALTDSLESRKHKNMFFCGEICDVDGVCGGYNLQWAWTSANIIAESFK